MSFEKESDSENELSLQEQVRNLKERLNEVAQERDHLIQDNRELMDVVMSKHELTDALFAEADWRETRLSAIDQEWANSVRMQMQAQVDSLRLNRVTANEMLEALGVRPLERRYRSELAFTVIRYRHPLF
ncbi:hypothetical protein ACQEVX_23100 [Streptomyces syringium]|uniref:hypothetical protein n=1 Tax=Streptomyces syringium TaxID=76729 RepID=UPI003D901F24